MKRDGRGQPGRIVLKNQPKLTLMDVLHRRRTTLANLLNELGLTTYTSLVGWCARMGVVAPTHELFLSAFPLAPVVNSASEGVVVLRALDEIDETQHQAEHAEDPVPATQQACATVTKKRRQQKETA